MSDFLHIVICQLAEFASIPERRYTFRHGEADLVEFDSIERAHVGPDTDHASQDGDRPEKSKDEDLNKSTASRYKLVLVGSIVDVDLVSEIWIRRELSHVDKSRTQSIRRQSVQNSVVINVSVDEGLIWLAVGVHTPNLQVKCMISMFLVRKNGTQNTRTLTWT